MHSAVLLFDEPEPPVSPLAPLAERMRPRTLEEVVGQRDITDRSGTLRRALAEGKPHSLILWGPPGTGKTTIAQAIARESDAAYESINAVTDGIADLRKVITRAKERRGARPGHAVLHRRDRPLVEVPAGRAAAARGETARSR